MLGFDKLASNARRFKMLMGMSLQEFDLLFTKVVKIDSASQKDSEYLWHGLPA